MGRKIRPGPGSGRRVHDSSCGELRAGSGAARRFSEPRPSGRGLFADAPGSLPYRRATERGVRFLTVALRRGASASLRSRFGNTLGGGAFHQAAQSVMHPWAEGRLEILLASSRRPLRIDDLRGFLYASRDRNGANYKLCLFARRFSSPPSSELESRYAPVSCGIREDASR